MPARTIDSPVLLAYLRAMIFVGVTESIFYRLLPAPAAGPPRPLGQIHALLYSSGDLMFFPAFFLVLICLVTLACRTLRHRFWPAGPNGFLAVCLLCIAALGLSALVMGRGPIFAIVFTLLALTAALFGAMHAFATAASSGIKAFAVCYSAAILSSAAGTIPPLASGLVPGAADSFLSGPALAAGELLLAAAGVMAFLAFGDAGRQPHPAADRSGLAYLLGAAAAAGFAAGCLLAPARLAPLGPDPGALRVFALSTALFLGVTTAAACLFDPRRRIRGYGLLLLLLPGYPLRIVHQHMMMALGTTLVFAPERAQASVSAEESRERPQQELA